MRKRFPPRLPAACLLALVTAACQGPSPVGTGTARVVVVSGDGQRGLAGEPLPRSVEVRLVGDGNRPLSGSRVDFAVAAGAGSVQPATATTDADGGARVRWTLGGREVRTQRITITTPDGPSATVEATALAPEETDVIVLRGALGPMKGVVLFAGDGSTVSIQQERAAPDTVVPLQPMDGGASMVLAFPWANRLGWAQATWTPGIDTVRVDLRPPVGLRMKVFVGEGPFEERKRAVEEHIATAQRIWDDEGVGVTFAEVEIVDLTTGGEIALDRSELCAFGGDRVVTGVIQAYYLPGINGGLACVPDLLFMQPDTRNSRLLAHELAHLFTLPHTGFGLMNNRIIGTSLTEGQIFRAHFEIRSALNVLFEAHPFESRRDCVIEFSSCLPMDYELP